MTFDPIKDGTTRAATLTIYKFVDYTKIHFHTKFERNLSRNVAVRAHTKI